jgi:hypothetical protein
LKSTMMLTMSLEERISISRIFLRDLLLEKLSPDTIEINSKFEKYTVEEDGSFVVHFNSGTQKVLCWR